MIRPNFRPFKETKYEGHCGKMRQIFFPALPKRGI